MLLGAAALATAPGVRAEAGDRVAAARAVVRELLAATPVAAFSIAVMRAEELVWAEAFGKDDV
jgi:hypothetical protein